MRIRLETCYLDIYMSTIFFCTDSPQNCQFFCCRDSPQNNHTNVTQMCIRAQPFSTYHSKICSDHVLFIPTWIPKRVQDLDLRNEWFELLSYGAYVYALGCYLMVNAANVLQDDGSRIVSRLRQTCTTTGVARKWVTTVTDVMILNYTVGLDVTRDGTQCNTQGVWPCKLPIDSLPLQILAMSPDLMEDLRKQPRRCFP